MAKLKRAQFAQEKLRLADKRLQDVIERSEMVHQEVRHVRWRLSSAKAKVKSAKAAVSGMAQEDAQGSADVAQRKKYSALKK